MTTADRRPDGGSIDGLLDAALPAALLVAVASWLPVCVLLIGYTVRLVRAELAGDPGLPPLDDVRGLVRTGVRAATVVAAAQFPTLVCLGGLLALRHTLGDGGTSGDLLGLVFAEPLAFAQYAGASPGAGLLLVVGLVITAVVAVLATYVGAASLVTFAVTDHLGPAFDPDTVSPSVRSPRFARGFLLASGLAGVGTAVAAVVALVPLVGPFAAAVVRLLVLVGTVRTVTAGYAESAAVDPAAGGDPPAAESPSAPETVV